MGGFYVAFQRRGIKPFKLMLNEVQRRPLAQYFTYVPS